MPCHRYALLILISLFWPSSCMRVFFNCSSLTCPRSLPDWASCMSCISSSSANSGFTIRMLVRRCLAWCEDPADYCLLLSLNLLLRLCSTLIVHCGSLHLGESAATQGFKFFVRIVFLGHQLAASLGLAFNSFATSAAVLFNRVRPCLVSFRPFLPSIATRSAF